MFLVSFKRLNLKFLFSKLIFSILFFVCSLLFVSCSRVEENQITEVLDLSGDGWVLILEDSPEYSEVSANVSGWEQISLPNNIRHLETNFVPVFWLRKTFDLDTSTIKQNLSLSLGRVYESDEVYLNGKLIGVNGKLPNDPNPNEYAYNRVRLYPIPQDALQAGQNVISIRIRSQFRNYAGILSGSLGIGYLQNSLRALFYSNLIDLVYIFVFVFIALFFLIQYIKLPEMKEYLFFSAFVVVFSFYELTKNEFRFTFGNYFLIYKFLEYLALFNIPLVYVSFVQVFFRAEKLKYQNHYFLLNALFPIIFAVFRQPPLWSLIVSFWSYSLSIPIVYSLHVVIKKFREISKESLTLIIPYLLFTFGLIIFIFGVVKEILIEKGFIHSESKIDGSLLFFIICIILALRFRFIILKLNILKRYEQLQEIDRLREKLFQYMNLILMPFIESSLQLTRSMKADFSSYSKENLNKIESNLKEIDNSLDDILELSRLEVKEDSPLKDTVNFVDFIKTIIPEGKISYTIKVNPAFQIHNTLDMVNSLMIRIIDFSGFESFTTKDLIITSDLKNQLHFRFMFYQKDIKKTQQIYKELNNKSITNIHQIRWAIIKELLRLLEGKLEMELVNKKYLRVDFELQALPLEKEEIVTVPIEKKKTLTLKLPEIKLESLKEKIKSYNTRRKKKV